jgi:hypothetical protein
MPWGCLPVFRNTLKTVVNGEEDIFPQSVSAGKSIPPQVRRNDSSLTSLASTRSTTAVSDASRSSVSFSVLVDEVYFDKNEPANKLYGHRLFRNANAKPTQQSPSLIAYPSVKRVERRHQIYSSLY